MNHKANNLETNNILLNLKASDDRVVDQAFSYLYQEYFSIIQHYIKENSGSEEDAADIFQDSLIVLYNKVREDQFKLTCALKTYIYSICRNLWLKRLRSKKQQIKTKDALAFIELEPDVSAILEEDEASKVVAKLLKEVDEDGEQVLIAYFFEGLSTSEVTKKMGYANEFVTRNKKSKSLKKLRALLQGSNQLKDFFLT